MPASLLAMPLNLANRSLAQRAVAEIRAEMGRQKLSGVKLAEILGWSQQFIARRLRGEIALTLDELEQIARALRVSPEQFTSPSIPPAPVAEPKRRRAS